MAHRLWDTFWRTCRRCRGKGYTLRRGERIPRDELTPAQRADELVQGGGHYRAEREPCSKCRGTGKRR
jgi:DnaJ-class molecular chaperone